MQKRKVQLYQKSDWDREVAIATSYDVSPEPYRSPARRDYARLIHSPAFRRLQGKTQLFPSHENDFFRNRLTHSIEVAQVAKSIALRINNDCEVFSRCPIDLDLVELAALAHDLGHPPFGHNGESALDTLMLGRGGFEGNAQTLRLLARLEKKETATFPSTSQTPTPFRNGRDERRGLNLTYRSLASVLKYDNQIPETKAGRRASGTSSRPHKGYYYMEAPLVERIKNHVGSRKTNPFKTIECSIMDISDDICYSTYDIEDSFKAGFISPVEILAASDTTKSKVAGIVLQRIKRLYPDKSPKQQKFDIKDLIDGLIEIFKQALVPESVELGDIDSNIDLSRLSYLIGTNVFAISREIRDNGYLRTSFTSELVGRFIRSVEIIPNHRYPQLSIARLDLETFKIVETLKAFAFDGLIESSRLKLAERRGHEIIEKIFGSLLTNPDLMPDDWRALASLRSKDPNWKHRVICDYIAGMSDRYCSDIYARLTGTDPITIFRAH